MVWLQQGSSKSEQVHSSETLRAGYSADYQQNCRTAFDKKRVPL